MEDMSLALDTSSVALDASRCDTSPLRDMTRMNIDDISVTLDTSHFQMYPLNNLSDMISQDTWMSTEHSDMISQEDGHASLNSSAFVVFLNMYLCKALLGAGDEGSTNNRIVS